MTTSPDQPSSESSASATIRTAIRAVRAVSNQAIAARDADRVVACMMHDVTVAVAHGPRFFEQPTCHSRPAVTAGVMAEESAALLKGFFKARR